MKLDNFKNSPISIISFIAFFLSIYIIKNPNKLIIIKYIIIFLSPITYIIFFISSSNGLYNVTIPANLIFFI
mgnify:CR=1 FL=1